MNPVLVTIFGIQIKWYSILILIGILIGLYLTNKEAKKFKINKEDIFNMLFYAVIFGIIGARLYYVLFNLAYYRYICYLEWRFSNSWRVDRWGYSNNYICSSQTFKFYQNL